MRPRSSGPRGALPALVAAATLTGALELRLQPEDGEQRSKVETVLVIPELKFLFCFIPKNACTQFNKLANSLNGLNYFGRVCSLSDPNWKSSWKFMLQTNETSDVYKLLKDPTWTKGVFYRDPLDRFVSAFKSECQKPRECGGCLGDNAFTGPNYMLCEFITRHPDRHKCYPKFDQVAAKLSTDHNDHFSPQSSFCGGPEMAHHYDFVGHLSSDYASVAKEARSMLESVLHKNPNFKVPEFQPVEIHDSPKPEASRSSRRRWPSRPSRTRLSAVTSQEQRQSFGERATESAAAQLAAELVDTYLVPGNEKDDHEPFFSGYQGPPGLELAERWFPASGPPTESGKRAHHHRTENVSAFYSNPATLRLALHYYAKDYTRLPGLQVPDWAAVMAREVFQEKATAAEATVGAAAK